ncbi:MAG: hypothetical protein ACXADY_10030 [Candidatus Hodarchaeales archaeon]|jgi:hypothetical protein
MTTIPELIRIYIKGFKQLFYHKGVEGEREKLSLLKIILFLLYLSAYLFTVVQFTDQNISNDSKQIYEEYDDYNAIFPLTIYGKFALSINIIILLGVLYFTFTGDKAVTIKRLKERPYQIYEMIVRNRAESLILVIIFLFISTQIILQYNTSFSFDEYEKTNGEFFIILYWIYKVSVFLWLFISPFLVISALVVSLDIFSKDYPKFMKGFNKKLVFFFCIWLIISILGILTLNNFLGNIKPSWSDPPIPVHGSSDILYYETGLYYIIEALFDTLLIFFILISISIFVTIRNRGSDDIRDRRTAIIFFIFPFILIYILLKAFPYLFTFGPRLKSLNNFIDLMSLVLIIFFAIFRVLVIQEEEDKPKKGFDLIPPYSKALFLLSLAFASFYVSLEANTILFLYNIQNEIRGSRLELSIGLLVIWLFYIFWRYKPLPGTLTNETRQP